MFFWVLAYINYAPNWYKDGEEIKCEEKYEVSKYEKNQCFVELDGKYYHEDIYLRMITWSAKK